MSQKQAELVISPFLAEPVSGFFVGGVTWRD